MVENVNEQQFKRIIQASPHGCTFCFFGRTIVLRADLPEITTVFKQVYARFVVDTQPPGDLVCYILKSGSIFSTPVLVIDSKAYGLPDTHSYIGHAELILFKYLIEQVDDYFLLHAGVVSRNDQAIVFFGQSGFGKTTLTLELVRRGYRFLSDEFCPIRLRDFCIEPFARRIGLKSSSPFYPLLEKEKSFYLEFEDKEFIDCEDLFPGLPGEECRACSIIELTGNPSREPGAQGRVQFDILLCNQDARLPDALATLEDIEVSERFMMGLYPTYRITTASRGSFISQFNSIWQSCRDDIFGVFPYKGDQPDYERAPVLNAVGKFEAVTSIMANLVNRAPAGRLMHAFGGKTAPIVMQLGNMVKHITCYTLQPGRLAEMADLIDNLEVPYSYKDGGS